MPADPRDYKVEISGVDAGSAEQSKKGKPFLSIHFACCGVYCRIYRNASGEAYVGRCPRCGKPVKFNVGAGGTDERYFVVE